MITPSTLSPQESLLSLIGGSESNAFTSCLSDIIQDTKLIFDWSDFPCESDYDMDESSFNMHQSNIWSCSPCSEEFVYNTKSLSDSLESSVEQSPRLYSTINYIAPTSPKESNSEQGNKKRRIISKSVKFASSLEIRTYSVILGEHPCCIGGLALQCGWDYNETPEIVDLEIYEQQKTRRGIRRPHDYRLSYSGRRDRLQIATGMSMNQLLHEEYQIACSDEIIQNGNDQFCKLETIHHAPSFMGLNSLWLESY